LNDISTLQDLPRLPDLAEIRIIRNRQLGWTQRQLGQATGLSQSFINKIERNEADPGYRAAKRIFETLSDASARKKRMTHSAMGNITALDIMAGNVKYVTSSQTIEEAKRIMIKNDYSQLPVIDNGIVKGSITDRLLVRQKEASAKGIKIKDIMERRFPVVDPGTKIETLRHLLEEYHAVLIDKGNREHGIVTRHDLLMAMK
jgi:predicted transcriptional regulator